MPDLGPLFPPEPPTVVNPRMYQVYVMNDTVTPMEYAKTLFLEIFSVTETDEIFRILHDKGQVCIGTYTRDVAETKVLRAMLRAEKAGYPLEFQIIPDLEGLGPLIDI